MRDHLVDHKETTTHDAQLHTLEHPGDGSVNLCEFSLLAGPLDNAVPSETSQFEFKISTESSERLACPFFKNEPTRHLDCINVNFQTWAHAKQHLRRKHYIEGYPCRRCGHLFPKKTTYNRHSHSCVPSHFFEEVFTDKIGEDEQSAIDNATKPRRFSDYERWNIAWDILFPGTQRPQSPYAQDPRIELTEQILKIMLSPPPSFVIGLVNERVIASEYELDTIIARLAILVRASTIPPRALGKSTQYISSLDKEVSDMVAAIKADDIVLTHGNRNEAVDADCIGETLAHDADVPVTADRDVMAYCPEEDFAAMVFHLDASNVG